jgi:NADH:ubiquinone oxidoreductase subunit 5 (subunit L)/multisubunit Na+/H+ antiporter MnhA subunit
MFRLLGYLESTEPGEAAKGHHGHLPHETSLTVKLVLGILCVVGLGFGFVSAPATFGGMGQGMYALINGGAEMPEGPTILHALPALVVSLLVAGVTFMLFTNAAKRSKYEGPARTRGLLAQKFYFDAVYESALFAPLRALGRFCSAIVESVALGGFELMGGAGETGSGMLRRLMSGKFQNYAALLLAAVFLMLLLLPGR